MRQPLSRLRAFFTLWISLALAGCACTTGATSALGYYWQSVRGHMQLMHAAEPIDQWIARTDIQPALRTRLQLAQRARAFAVTELGLPDNASYRRYADLKRPAAVWNVVAAPPYALTLHTWCFPVTGCIGYRGYFTEADAQAEAAELAAQGLEVEVYGVPAYSTLGYMNWAGGDPLLSTFIAWPEGDFVRLLFHELAHQVVYAKDDTLFNESFATAVERIGIAQWLSTQSTPEARDAFATSEARRSAFRALTRATRARLAEVYEQKETLALDGKALAAMKTEAMQQFRADYAALRARWLQPQDGSAPQATTAQVAGYDRWVAKANNASFAAQAAYDELVPAFEALFEREGRDWTRFYDAVRQLTQAPRPQRHDSLRALLPATNKVQ
ncbi:MAG: aminopeptidase [Gammaproteobacteria bacterium]|nr:aminopeptidase [Gammaproteobacteria bacterium]MBU1507216.1 aminopeptidase [Gammaproteobacteria bacterium]MBU2121260.1 aminopeptidase [Gammaproteobacteria bacterium]MBU2171023.1 aminopeptidase [Gammaproteobacteria bacterium]MBU2201665.1 aminopeptidase [Gammaproteobacteria bacterium]